jgi:hypothetical protein
MLMTRYLNRVRHLLIGLFITVIMISASQPAFAQLEFDPEKEYFHAAKVLTINGNIIECERGLVADISNARVNRNIEVGDLLFAFGQLTDDANFKTLIHAENVSVVKTRDVELDGPIQSVDGNSLTMLNQRVEIDAQTELIGADSLQAGQAAYVYTEYLNNSFRAFRIIVSADPKNVDLGIISAITSIQGTKVALMGDFSVNISAENLDFFKKNGVGINSLAYVNLRQEPKTKKLKSPFLGIHTINMQVGGRMQAVDPVNKTVTVLNQVIPISQATRVDDGFSRLKLDEINLDDYEFAQVAFDFIKGKPYTSFVFLLRKQPSSLF